MIPFAVPPEGVSIGVHGGTLKCNGVPVRELDDPSDHLTYCVPDGHYLDVYLRRSDGSLYSVVIDLDVVGIEDEACIRIELDPAVQQVLVFPPLRRAA